MSSSEAVLPKKYVLQEWSKSAHWYGSYISRQRREYRLDGLGCDDRTQGAASWAAAKLNLLDVALTRAQHRFFMIGDARLWRGLSYFMAAHHELLPRIS